MNKGDPQAQAFGRILLEAAVICALGVVVGLSINYQLVYNAFSGKVVATAPVQQAPEGQQFPAPVELEEVRRLKEQGAVLIDARAGELYREGHIPSSVSLPLGQVDERLQEFKDDLPRDVTLIAYCSGYGCPDSFDLGMRLLDEGYQDVRVFEGGLPEWRDAGLPVTEQKP